MVNVGFPRRRCKPSPALALSPLPSGGGDPAASLQATGSIPGTRSFHPAG
jgi:hypothetical protein